MKASVIVVVHAGAHHLEDSLGSLGSYAERSDVEVVLVDNASSDRSGDAAIARWPWVKVVRSETNLGFAGGVHLGAEAQQRVEPRLGELHVVRAIAGAQRDERRHLPGDAQLVLVTADVLEASQPGRNRVRIVHRRQVGALRVQIDEGRHRDTPLGGDPRPRGVPAQPDRAQVHLLPSQAEGEEVVLRRREGAPHEVQAHVVGGVHAVIVQVGPVLARPQPVAVEQPELRAEAGRVGPG